MNAWLTLHRVAVQNALRRLWRSPLNTLLSVAVIGIALTLPAAGYALLDSLRGLSSSATATQQISLFLTLDAEKKDIAALEERLRAAAVGPWRLVTRDEALKNLQTHAGMAEIVASLPRNPLPDALIVEPLAKAPETLDAYRQTFANWPKVAHVQLDSAWVRRFDVFLRLGKLAVTLLSALFAAGLVAITFNTIRLQVLSQAAEIELARLIGATNAFIRRPFYYFGAAQGALGGALAAGLVSLGFWRLNGPVAELAALYGGQFALSGPSAADSAALVAVGSVLGWLGAQLSVSLSLRQLG